MFLQNMNETVVVDDIFDQYVGISSSADRIFFVGIGLFGIFTMENQSMKRGDFAWGSRRPS